MQVQSHDGSPRTGGPLVFFAGVSREFRLNANVVSWWPEAGERTTHADPTARPRPVMICGAPAHSRGTHR